MTPVDEAPAVAQGPPDDAGLLAELAEALSRVSTGDFKVRLQRRNGLAGEVADRLNQVIEIQELRNRELLRIRRVVGREGRLTERIDDEQFVAPWADGMRAVNALIDDLGRPTTEVARVIVAVAEADLSQKMSLDLDVVALKGPRLR